MPKLTPGVNDLASQRPDIAAQWHHELNGELRPEGVTVQSNRKAWWQAPCGHAPWGATVCNRTGLGRGCPTCAGRRTEVGVNDLASQRPDIAAEWHDGLNGDLRPEDIPVATGRMVWWSCADPAHSPWQATVGNRTSQDTTCPTCAGRRTEPGVNDVATTHPALAAEWADVLNGELRPEHVSAGCQRKVWWSCANPAHSPWQATVGGRTGQGSSCPTCAGQRTEAGVNDLASLRPDIAAEWAGELNGELRPEQVPVGTARKVWWQAGCGHAPWEAPVNSRTGQGSGCPTCAGLRVEAGVNDLAFLRPDIAAEWHVELNGGLRPEEVSVGANRKVWWQGLCGHAPWEATVKDRTGRGTGCPTCAAAAASFIERKLFEATESVLDDAKHGGRLPVAWGKRKFTSPDISGRRHGVPVVVEYDGERWHRNRVEMDCEKTTALLDAGYRVVRVRSGGLDNLPLTHANLLQLPYVHRYGRYRLAELEASLVPVVDAITGFLAAG